MLFSNRFVAKGAMKLKLAIAFVLGLSGLAGVSVLAFQSVEGKQHAIAGGMSGYLEALLEPGNADSAVRLPDIAVFVDNMDTGSVVARTKTESDGYYELQNLPEGRYQLCWEARGWASGCKADPVVLSQGEQYDGVSLDSIDITPEGGRMITGRVGLAGGAGCSYSNPLFGIEQDASVSAFDKTGRLVGGPVRPNESGEYVVAGPPAEDLRVTSNCAAGTTEGLAEGPRIAAGVVSLDLTVDSPPMPSVAITARLVGQPVRSVPPGATVDLEVQADASGEGPLQYRWAATSRLGGAISGEGDHVQWTAPSESGDGQIHVLASNGRGRFSEGAIVMKVGPLEIGNADPGPTPYAQMVVTAGKARPTPQGEYIPPYKNYSATTNGTAFLTLRGNAAGAAQTYYRIVAYGAYTTPPAGQVPTCATDTPPKPRCTFGTWLTANGWNANGTTMNGFTEARTVFLNHNDLGYVRDMHCLQNPNANPNAANGQSKVACWVTNYSTPANQEAVGPPYKTPPALNTATLDANFVSAEMMDATKAQATVTMEYRVITGQNGGNPVVTFIAYGNPAGTPVALANAAISEYSDQDGFSTAAGLPGLPVPGMCNNCHGGTIEEYTSGPVAGGVFIVFDASTFIFPTKTDANPMGGNWTRPMREAMIKAQNMAVKATGATPAIVALINGWYAGAGPMGCSPPFVTTNDCFAPPGWMVTDPTLNIPANQQVVNGARVPLTPQKLYLNVVRTCRTCHTALRPGITWDSYATFKARAARPITSNGSFASRVCGSTPDMPHDAISYLNFWRFQPPGQPPFGSMYPMGGNNSQNPMLVMQQPFMDMGALIVAAMPNVPVPPVGNCKNGKGMPKL